ncbi:amino acid ABC transporter substrate-binding protein [Candidatus Galacturonibacter soehngenii]|uniref:Amino acid ABC transporter substrate-binding protein n=1 Tax=Candidatus Galacturonatibacter soehngenii TaxID=2307010 RepID=A0A7V7QKN8_9FIRM|nr:amino acid ABC transporter substrate-binding protein [Candidatus Galacturonibacter soehngenii]KAB1438397.1 amino acid ABC transporter substrate-binding protein [Candidatus Galacturonibacter soehngenii]
MKKFLAIILSVGMVFSMGACGNSNNDSASKEKTSAESAKEVSQESANTKESNTIVVGFDQDFPPFGYVGDDGEYTGFDIEMAKECVKRMGKEIVLQPIDWDAKDMELEAGTIDCIWNGFTINGREDKYTWTKAYMDNSQVFVVKADSGITSLEDLAGKVVEVQKESSAQTALEDDDHKDLLASFGQFLTVDQYNTAFMDLESGAVDAIGIDIGVAHFQLEGKEDKFTILKEQISSEQYGIGFLKGNEELRDKVEAALMELVEDGTFAEISNKYFGYDVSILGE